VTESALAGAHIATVPLKVLRQMVRHPLTDSGTLQFRRDWAAAHSASDESNVAEPAPVGAGVRS